MSTYRISEVAQRTGFSPPTIRYYEEIGLIPAPSRRESGYRFYDDRSLERLTFIGRAKQLGISLEEIRELAPIWELDECAPLQRRLADLVTSRLVETRERIVELAAFAEQLQVAMGRLGTEPKPGPCGPECACDVPAAESTEASKPIPISCTLEAGEAEQRLDDWRALQGKATAREAVVDGVRLRFPAEAGLATEVARLAAAEHSCCAFLDFTLRIVGGSIALEVRGPAAAAQMIAILFGGGGMNSGGGGARSTPGS
jgi:DNA-binding transcriptional MerR regulator